MFGHYLHALTAHSPIQYELCCQRSLNTENQERLFGQARLIAESCTNHHAENIPQVMLRLQAKQQLSTTLMSVEKSDSQVSHIAKHNLFQDRYSYLHFSERERAAGKHTLKGLARIL